jgi:hypothetical protein
VLASALRIKAFNWSGDFLNQLSFKIAFVNWDGYRLLLVPGDTEKGDRLSWGLLEDMNGLQHADEPIPVVVREVTSSMLKKFSIIGRFYNLRSFDRFTSPRADISEGG